MKITEIEIFPVTIPFSGGFASSLGTATGTWEICRFVVVKVHTDEGITGYGEVPPWLRVGKESQSSIIPIIQNYLASELIGEDPFNIAKIWVKMDAAAPENTMAKTPLDLVFYDIMREALGVPVCELPRPDGRSFVRRVLSNDSWQPYSPRAIHPPTTSYPCGFRSYFEDLIALFSTRYIAPSSQIIILPMI